MKSTFNRLDVFRTEYVRQQEKEVIRKSVFQRFWGFLFEGV